jgi:hypothetical protein
MKNRSIFAVLPLILVIFGLFVACDDPTNPDSSQKQKEPGIAVSGKTLAEKLQWLSTNAESNSRYFLEVTTAYEELAPQNITPSRSNITIQLKGTGNERIIALLGTGSLLSIGNGITLILDGNLTLAGTNSNTASFVTVASGGTLIMNKGAKITGNNNRYVSSSSSSGDGGGVYVNGGTFTMSGGEISGNTANYYGGGVYVGSGTFTMSGGEISGNTAHYFGGGVYVNNTKRRGSTAGPGVNLDSRVSGAAGGWE